MLEKDLHKITNLDLNAHWTLMKKTPPNTVSVGGISSRKQRGWEEKIRI